MKEMTLLFALVDEHDSNKDKISFTYLNGTIKEAIILSWAI